MTAGNCSATNDSGNVEIYSQPHVLLAKESSSQGTICTIQTTDIQLQVNVPANQAPGTYVGTLTITLPSF
ncbi:TPA: hypothetical protein DEP21_02555 [Patescibacteria group bacterium]|nr:hypothetical protein [Candidatus Gracilibacteria bacterium]